MKKLVPKHPRTAEFVAQGLYAVNSFKELEAKISAKDVDFRSVDGSMNMGERRKIMEVIKDSPRALLANAKCLTEGVNWFRLTNHMVGGVGAGPRFDGWLFPGEPRRRR